MMLNTQQTCLLLWTTLAKKIEANPNLSNLNCGNDKLLAQIANFKLESELDETTLATIDSMASTLEMFVLDNVQTTAVDAPINTTDELVALQNEFAYEIDLPNSNGSLAPKAVTNAARKLAQHSNENYSIVVPDNAERIEAGDGSGDWVPALIFVPNESVKETYCEIERVNNTKVLQVSAEQPLHERLCNIGVWRSASRLKVTFALCESESESESLEDKLTIANIICEHFLAHTPKEILAFDYIEVIRA